MKNAQHDGSFREDDQYLIAQVDHTSSGYNVELLLIKLPLGLYIQMDDEAAGFLLPGPVTLVTAIDKLRGLWIDSTKRAGAPQPFDLGGQVAAGLVRRLPTDPGEVSQDPMEVNSDVPF